MTPREVFAELQGLDMQNPGSWPRWVHVAAVTLAAVFIIGFGVYFFVMPEYDNLGTEQQKEVTLKQDFERKQKKVAALDAYRAQLETMERDFGAMLRQLPSKTEVENLLNDISQTRVASNLEEELFQPEPETPKDFYAEIPHKIVVTGTYNQMGTFVAGVAALPRIVTIDEVEIKPVGAAPGALPAGVPKGNLRMSALAKTYRYLDANEIAAQPKPGAPGGPAK